MCLCKGRKNKTTGKNKNQNTTTTKKKKKKKNRVFQILDPESNVDTTGRRKNWHIQNKIANNSVYIYILFLLHGGK